MSEANTIEQFAERLAQADAPDETENAQPEAEAQSEESQDEPQTEVEQEESTDEPEGESDQPETESLDERVVAWETASGEKFEVPVAELKNGYMREQDYRHKTQTFAAERDAAAKQVQQQFQMVGALKQEYGALSTLDSQLQSLEQAIPQMDKHNDPTGYYDAVTTLLMLKEQRSGLANRVSAAEQHLQAQHQQHLAQQKEKAREYLQANVPGFSQGMLDKASSTVTEKYGFSMQELASFADPRIVRAFIDLAEYHSLQAKKPAVMNKVKAAPPKPTKQASTAVESDIQKQVKAFGKKKDLNSFAALLAKTL